VLIVEDELVVAWDLARRLTHLRTVYPGHAGHGAEAVQYVTALQPDVVLMEIYLSGLLTVRLSRPTSAALAIRFIAGFLRPREQRECT
jgi:CheY-like chemotaxis protein